MHRPDTAFYYAFSTVSASVPSAATETVKV